MASFSEEGRFGVRTLMCLSLFMLQFVGWACSLGLVFRWRESIQILNSWEIVVADIDETDGERTPYDDVPSGLLLIHATATTASCAAAQPIISLLFSKLPVCIHSICEAAGLIPDVRWMTPFIWQLAFLPAERTDNVQCKSLWLCLYRIHQRP